MSTCAGIIYASYDGGDSWEDPVDLPFSAGDAPSSVVVADGRIWKAVPGSAGNTFASASVNADLMDPSSWEIAGDGSTGAPQTYASESRNHLVTICLVL